MAQGMGIVKHDSMSQQSMSLRKYLVSILTHRGIEPAVDVTPADQRESVY